ncbi:DUF3823 domain-containing protein [Zunongwangia atlantica]|uniref:DUF3823 domain-containing protein n=1 Tax=Zunongwangia atlantica 22II14-10F7 TaxID=1185767 RepID=A0A1Y1T1J2_9FLAO|nr:DUF3823 domain-containing protein [Zunongwangia atlantica]ORL44891.1 hypothetical protein IIF7_13832 [Zunongwangia atlantica 22II14-10F7]
MKKYIIYSLVSISLMLAGCEKDNFDAPNAMLEGQVTYQGEPISVRSNSAEFQIWQDGYALDEFIPVFIAQDGTYSVSLFAGEYKLVRRGGDPWLPQLNDTIVVQVDGTTQVDIPVTPYINISNESFQVNGQTLSASFQIDQIVEDTNVQEVSIMLSRNILLDRNINDFNEVIELEDFEFGTSNSIDIEIPESLRGEGYLYVRVGARSSMANELIYTNAQQIDL